MILRLSRRVQRAAQRRLRWHAFFNACGFGLTTDQVVYLFALHYGATDTQSGFLYAAIHLTALAALFAPLILNGRETTRIWTTFWFLRAVVCLGYFALPFLATDAQRVWGIVLIYFVFATGRSFGMSAAMPVQKALAAPNELPGMVAGLFGLGQLGVLLVRTISFLLFASAIFQSDQTAFLVLLGLGTAANFTASYCLSRLPPTGYLEEGSLSGFVRAAREIRDTPAFRETAVLTLLNTGILVCGAYVNNFLKREAGLTSGWIFFLVVLSLVGTILVSRLLRAVGGRITNRALMFTIHCVLLLMALAWTMVRAVPGWNTVPVLAVLTPPILIAIAASVMLVFQLWTSRIPEGRGVQVSILYQLAAVAASLLAVGWVRIGDGLGAALPLPGTHAYTHVFLAIACLSGGILAVTFLGRGAEGRALLQDLTLLGPANLMTMYRAHRLEEHDATPARRLQLEGLMLGPSATSRQLLLEALDSPDLHKRLSALRTLFAAPRPEAFGRVLAEARDPESPLRMEAIVALGFLGNRYAEEPLRAIFAGAAPELAAAAAKSLLRLGAPPADDELRACWAACTETRQRLDLCIGLAETDRSALLLDLLARDLAHEPGPRWSEAAFALAAATWDQREAMIEIYAEEHRQRGGGLEYILADVEPGVWPEGLEPDALRALFGQEEYAELAHRLGRALPGAAWIRAHDRSTALGVLFLFTLARTAESTGSPAPKPGE